MSYGPAQGPLEQEMKRLITVAMILSLTGGAAAQAGSAATVLAMQQNERGDRGDRGGRPDRGARPERGDRPVDFGRGGDRGGDRGGQPAPQAQRPPEARPAPQAPQAQQPDRGDRGDRGGWQGRGDRPDQIGRAHV